jgi:hypothetical protein
MNGVATIDVFLRTNALQHRHEAQTGKKKQVSNGY